MPDETDTPTPVVPVNLPDDTQATASSTAQATEMPPEAPEKPVAPESVLEAPEVSEAPVEVLPLVEAPATGVPLVGIDIPADGTTHEVTLEASPAWQLADGGIANMQHELIAARDAAVNAQAAHARVKDAHDKLLAAFQAAAEELEMRRALPSTEHFQAQIDALQQRLEESEAKVQALTEEKAHLLNAQPA